MSRTLAFFLMLAGCSGVHAPTDAGCVEDDAGPAPSFDARLACGILGHFHARQVAAGPLAACPEALPCPFPFDPIDPTSGRCDPLAVEDCIGRLEATVNDCAGYVATIEGCASECDR